jgi:peptidyl-tRNA hydrolase, PTH1 family
VAGLKVIVGLGNPGPEYAPTRHNAGWWLLDALRDEWKLPRFRAEKQAAVVQGRVDGRPVRLVKPLTWMNRSGDALRPLTRMNALELTRDLLVVVDDIALEPGVVRFRPSGSAGGHNGLKSVEATLGTQDYARLRIGVGARPPGTELVEWVLSAPPEPEREVIVARFPQLVGCVRLWMEEGTEAAMSRCNG